MNAILGVVSCELAAHTSCASFGTAQAVAMDQIIKIKSGIAES